MSEARFYSQGDIDEVRERADVVEVISQYLTLKPAGSNFKGLCPFHKEKTPSFIVSPQRQMFHCFGCGEGGNVFSFVMKMEGLTFGEAVRMLAQRYGVRLQAQVGKEIDKQAQSRQRLLDLNRKVMAHFQRNLVDQATGAKALEYLGRRGVSDEAIRTFSLGYAPEGWDNLLRTFGKSEEDRRILSELGLVSASKQGKFYDRFRDRLIFPIVDVMGNVRGFGGRVLETSTDPEKRNEEPKYLNSPETAVYQKGQMLYGLCQARDAVRSQGYVVLVEGYMDVIALFEGGIRNAVATLGTALTSQQCRLIKRYTEAPVVFFDADSAGTIASLRSFDLFCREGLWPRAFKASDGLDPDDYIKAVGGDKLEQQLSNAAPYPEFLIEETCARFDLRAVENKVKALKAVLPSLARLRTEVETEHYVKVLAERLQIESAAAFQELCRHRRGWPIKEEVQVYRGKDFVVEERDLIRLIVVDEDSLRLAAETVDPDLITDPFLRELFEFCVETYRKGEKMSLAGLLDKFEDDSQREYLTHLAFCDERAINRAVLAKVSNRLSCLAAERQAADAHARYLSAVSSGDEELELELSKELLRLKKTAVLK